MQETAAKTVIESSLGDTWPGIALLFVLFLVFFAGSTGYGIFLRRRLAGNPGRLELVSDGLLFGSLALYASAFILATAGALRLVPGWTFGIALLPGIPAWLSLRGGIGEPRRTHCWSLGVLAVVCFVRALSAAVPAQHGDPLLYHLLGPRLWAERGGFFMHPDLPNALLASTWECLYVWPEVFFRSVEPLYGLVEAQLFAQWLHLFVAWLGGGLLVMRAFRGSVCASWLPLVGFAALFVSGLQWTAALAKNDAGIAFWTLGAVVLFREARDEKRGWKFGASGLFAGLALAGKITALLSLAPLLGLLAFFGHRRFAAIASDFVRWLVGFALGAAPLYARNYLLSGNPFFPLFNTVFPSRWVSRSWGAHFAQVHPSSPLHSLGRLLTRFPELVRETPWVLPALLFTLWIGAFARQRRDILAYLAGSFAAYAIFVVTQAPEIELRYLGASLLLLAGGGVVATLSVVERIPAEVAKKFAVAALLVSELATSRLPLHLLRKIWRSPLGVAYVRTHSAGEAKAWIRAHTQGSYTIVAGDNETYYLTPVPVAVLTERPDLDEANEKTNFGDFLSTLCDLSHARYLLDARPAIGVEARFGAGVLAPAKVFEAQGARVYDLRRLNGNCR